MKYYTWKDVERHFQLEYDSWNTSFDAVEVYPSSIIVYKKSEPSQSVKQIFNSLFPANFDAEKNSIQLDIGDAQIPIVEEASLQLPHKPTLPLFRDVLYRKSSYPEQPPKPLACDIIAYHSYKGGVGRTLSLLAFAKAWSNIFSGTERSKLLIIDSDIEAPGLTWLQSDDLDNAFSYLDLLTLIQDNTSIETIVDLACSKIGTSTISVETKTRIIEHIFIPTYRYKEQLLDIYASPDTIVNGRKKEYILAQVISEICKKLGAAAALIDLRAGLSEFSSTLLLDPRVKKYLVTSTSTQSIEGTKIILEYLTKGLQIHEDTNLPEIFLSMIPEFLPLSEKHDLISALTECYDQGGLENESDSFIDNVVTSLPFASELIHLTSLKQILTKLDDREMYTVIYKLVDQNYHQGNQEYVQSITSEYRVSMLKKIHSLAEMQITAEGNSEFDLLMTSSLKYLKNKFKETIPATIMMGAKGSGKTFLYRKFVKARDWNSFCASLDKHSISANDGYFLPILATANAAELIPSLQACIEHFNNTIPNSNVPNDVFLINDRKLKIQKENETNWFEFWDSLLASSFNKEFSTLEEVSQALRHSGQRIVFLIDGLEEVLVQIAQSDRERQIVKALCQDVINTLIARYDNIGMISFLRRDMAHNVFSVNFAQFEQMHGRAELKWSFTEALRLAVWLINQADQSFYKESVGIDVASQEIIEQSLIKLWGLKLGKSSSNEAYSSRWILAALSDFNGQLQARDIIRFLKYATVPNTKKAVYDDRILMPTDIKYSVSQCSSEKIEEVKQEYSQLKIIFEKLEDLPLDQKVLPFRSEQIDLSSAEEKSMVQEGYLKRDGDKYYLPEIIRHALNFRYERGARPKVLSLILKR